MTCPDCGERMTHQGYFRWDCGECGGRHTGDLPPPREEQERD